MSGLRRYDLAHMLSTDPPKVPWVVKPLCALGEVTTLYGPPGAGKSLLSLGLANAIAAGLGEFAGFRCVSGRAVYIDAENGTWETHRRVQSLGVDPKRLTIFDGTEAHLLRDYDEIEAAIEEEEPRLVVLDSLRRLLPGVEENDSASMAQAVGLCKLLAQRLRVAVLLIHHPKKSGEDYRGSSAIGDQTSILYRLDREKGDIDRLRRTLTNQKMRIAPEPPSRFIRVGVEDGRVVIQGALEPAEGEVAAGTASADLVPRVLALLEKEQRTRAQVAKALGRVKSDNTVRRVFDQLEAAGRITQNEDGAWRALATATPSPAGNGKGVGKGVAKSVATGKGLAREGGKGVAKSSRAKQPGRGNPKRGAR